MRKASIFLLIFAFSASVAAFPASIEVLDKSASPDNSATFDVNINNNLSTDATFRVNTFSPKPSWVYVEQSKNLEPGENTTFKVTVTPDEYAVDQTYSLTVYARSSATDYSRTMKTSFNVDRDRQLILEDFNLNKTDYTPGEQVNGNIKIRSISSQVLRDYRAEIGYDEKSTSVSSSPILPGGTREISFVLPTDREAVPDTKQVKADLLLDQEVVESSSKNFTIGEVREVSHNSSETNDLVSITGTETVRNEGNTPINYTVNKTISSYLTPITGFNRVPTSERSQGSFTVYSWEQQLQPGEEFTVVRNTNYWVPAVALVALVGILAGIKKLRNSVKLNKTAKKTAQGLKVSIEVENISDRKFRNVEVKDFVPDIADVDKKFEMARPTMRMTNEGTKLSWSIEELEPGDQIVLQYTLRPKVEVEGGIDLPGVEIFEGEELIEESDEFNVEFSP